MKIILTLPDEDVELIDRIMNEKYPVAKARTSFPTQFYCRHAIAKLIAADVKEIEQTKIITLKNG